MTTAGRRRAIGVVLGLAMVANTACYAYVPAPTGLAPAPGARVRVRLNADGTATLAQFLGPRVEYAEGLVNEVRSDGTIVVAVNAIRLLDGIDQFWSGASIVPLPAQYVAEVQRRELDRHRTRIAAIGAIVAVIGIFALALAGGGAHGGPDAGGAPPPP